MKISKHILFPIIISLVLFVIPFFWFKPGEMDLGGDTSRLYFYDPASYLHSAVLYVISPSGYGFENFSIIYFPFILILALLKSTLFTSTALISGVYGLSLSAGFFFCYLTIRELMDSDSENSLFAAIVGGLLYIFSPALIDGWKHVLLTYNQVFLNPLMFYLLLKYLKSSKIYILFTVILLTFVFSANFSFVASPSIFAFYPLGILFLVLYTKLILKRKIILKHIFYGLILFLGIQAFHVLPMLGNIFTSGSDINSVVFAAAGKYDRGLSYFSAIAPNIKASINLLGLPQMIAPDDFSKVFLVLPFIIFVSFLFNKKKTILLTTVFFVIILFFATANITNVWLSIYKSLFFLPGFSMFRNFYGQWQDVYVFFYSILFGQALYVLLNRLSLNRLGKVYSYILMLLLVSILVINAIPLIRGDVTRGYIWQSNKVKGVLQIDPDYEKMLAFVHSLPVDGRVLTLPLTDSGYQIVAGIDGGAYLGPSTIAYLAGKKDFTGYADFGEYKDLVLDLIRNNEFETLKRIFGILNIRYVFYNADPLIYDNFPTFPYQYVRTMLSKDQKSYKQFLDKLHLKEIKNINNKFFVFELPDNYYLPQINITKESIHTNKPFTEISAPLSIDSQDIRIAVDNSYKPIPENYPIKFDETLTDIQGKNSFSDFFVNADNSVGFPYAFSAWTTNSLIYPFLVFRENMQLSKLKKVDFDAHIETAILILDKRIGELERWGRDVPILGNIKSIKAFDQSWQEPSIWEALISRNKYDAWEIGFLRYQRQIYDLISNIEKPNNSLYSSTANKEKLKKAVVADRDRFYTIIEKDIKLSKKNKVYLLKLCIGMFDSIMSRLQSKIPSPEEIFYNLNDLGEGDYQVFIDKKSVGNVDQSRWQIVVNGRKLFLKDFLQDDNWYTGQNITVKDPRSNILTLLSAQSTNLLSEDKWRLSEEKNLDNNFVSLSIANSNLPNSNGLIQEIDDWSPSSYYILSFEYLTHGKSFKIIAYDKSLEKDGALKAIFGNELRSSEWKSYETIFQSSNEAYSASLQILKSERGLLDTIDTKDTSSKIELKNLSIIKVPNPKIILKKIITPPVQNEILPKITFTRINPTKYELKVQNVTGPYTLVLAEQFNQNWRLIDPTQNTSTVKAFLSRLLANVLGKVSSLENKSSSVRNTQLTYFGGDVKENSSGDVFLNEKTFETWGKREIAEYKHFSVNGYSNAWYIEPKDMGGKTDYMLIIEMTEQKKIYIGLAISLSCVFLTIAVLLKSLLKRK